MQTDEAVMRPSTKDAFQLKGSLFTLTIMQVVDLNCDKISIQLDNVVAGAPNFFQQAPMVLDFNHCKQPPTTQQLSSICDALQKHNISPIGICGDHSDILRQAAAENHLALFPKQKTEKSPSPAKTDASTRYKTRLITQPVRSGQQIYAKDADLIVTASVSNGAEILADGNIHIYGTLKGRALAGVGGDQDARIFCQQLEAELVSIAGLYQLNEDFAQKYPNKNMQIYLDNERLCISEL